MILYLLGRVELEKQKISLYLKKTIKKIQKLFSRLKNYFNKERILSLGLLSKIVSLIIILSISPLEAGKVKASESDQKVYNSFLQLDVQKSLPIILPEGKKPEINIGESDFDRKIREVKEQLRKTPKESSRVVISRERERSFSNVSFEEKRNLVKEAASQYGIDWRLLEAVWEVESGKSWDTAKKSYAGATGPMQFMPSTFRNHAVDGDGDGQIEITSAKDAVYSAAKFLADCGASSGNIDQALLSYNHAQWYVNKVKGVADSIQN